MEMSFLGNATRFEIDCPGHDSAWMTMMSMGLILKEARRALELLSESNLETL